MNFFMISEWHGQSRALDSGSASPSSTTVSEEYEKSNSLNLTIATITSYDFFGCYLLMLIFLSLELKTFQVFHRLMQYLYVPAFLVSEICVRVLKYMSEMNWKTCTYRIYIHTHFFFFFFWWTLWSQSDMDSAGLWIAAQLLQAAQQFQKNVKT